MVPTKGDPARPVALAVNAARTLGVLLLIIAALVLTVTGMLRPAGESMLVLVLVVAFVGVYGVPGVLFIVFAGQLKQWKAWAAVVLIVMGSLVALLAAAAAVSAVVRVSAADSEDASGALGTLAFATAILASAVLLNVQAARSIKVIRVFGQSPTTPRGFQPIMAREAAEYAPHPPPQSPPTPSQPLTAGDERRAGDPGTGS